MESLLDLIEDKKDVLKTAEVMEFLGVSKHKLNKLIKDGKIEVHKNEKNRNEFYKDEIEKYKEEHGDSLEPRVDARNNLNDLTGKEWLPETKSFWYQKGLGASHPHAQIEKQHPAPFSFQDVQRLVLFFTKKGQKVLDPFSGTGSTIKACALSERIGVGIELSSHWCDLSKHRIEYEVGEGESSKHVFINKDCREALENMENNSIDLVITSPPYWSILNKKIDHKTKKRVEEGLATNYSDDKKDLANIDDYQEFLEELKDVFIKSAKVLKDNKYMCIIVSDFRNQSEFVSFHSDIIQIMNKCKIDDKHELMLQGVKALLQNHKSLLPYGYPFSYVENIHHQYILIFKKQVKKVKKKAKEKSNGGSK
ncbi:helix-turn-helix domain-containing protein [Clostridium sardiniense]|uniref:Methyltransferase n=1 Tax=Clostridium sardiniense TaxID=29369 RepID=A0ABS7L182_CLOSR|nr:DNA methyltransferase [Clostridium sardiniense]MBY0756821.1 helix-turn-helix domain-containing protein [Clostridium sardiniense]MDQ0458663.1 DNA modification methylase [Clostridium sardiniense]